MAQQKSLASEVAELRTIFEETNGKMLLFLEELRGMREDVASMQQNFTAAVAPPEGRAPARAGGEATEPGTASSAGGFAPGPPKVAVAGDAAEEAEEGRPGDEAPAPLTGEARRQGEAPSSALKAAVPELGDPFLATETHKAAAAVVQGEEAPDDATGGSAVTHEGQLKSADEDEAPAPISGEEQPQEEVPEAAAPEELGAARLEMETSQEGEEVARPKEPCLADDEAAAAPSVALEGQASDPKEPGATSGLEDHDGAEEAVSSTGVPSESATASLAAVPSSASKEVPLPEERQRKVAEKDEAARSAELGTATTSVPSAALEAQEQPGGTAAEPEEEAGRCQAAAGQCEEEAAAAKEGSTNPTSSEDRAGMRMSEWNGKWSHGSPSWKEHPEVALQVGYEPSNDGVFWMSWEDFRQTFDKVCVLAKSMARCPAKPARATAAPPGGFSVSIGLDRMADEAMRADLRQLSVTFDPFAHLPEFLDDGSLDTRLLWEATKPGRVQAYLDVNRGSGNEAGYRMILDKVTKLGLTAALGHEGCISGLPAGAAAKCGA